HATALSPLPTGPAEPFHGALHLAFGDGHREVACHGRQLLAVSKHEILVPDCECKTQLRHDSARASCRNRTGPALAGRRCTRMLRPAEDRSPPVLVRRANRVVVLSCSGDIRNHPDRLNTSERGSEGGSTAHARKSTAAARTRDAACNGTERRRYQP